MTGTEERLAQALRARTDLITHDRLTPSAPPVAAKPRSPLRRPAFALLAAAACAAAIALPFALAGGDGQKPDPVGPTTARPTSAPVAPSPTMTVSAVPDPALPPFASENAASTILPGEAARLADNRWGIETLSMPAVDPAADVLMVSWADGSAAQIDLPDEGDWVPQVSTTLVTGDSPGVLVTWEQRDGAIQRVYSTAGHRLAEIVPQSAFGLNASEDGGNPRSVLGLDGTIYTSVEPDDARGVKILIYEWSAGDENLLLANGGRSTGTWCLIDEPVTWRRC